MDFHEKDMVYLESCWHLDSLLKSESNLKHSINAINTKSNSNIIRTIYEEKRVSPLMSAIQNSRTLLLNFLLIIFCIVISLIKATMYWIDKITLELGIRRMYGASNKNIVLHITKRYLSISIFLIFIASIFQKLLIVTNVLRIQYGVLNIFNILASVIFILIIGIIVIGISAFNINKTQISYLI